MLHLPSRLQRAGLFAGQNPANLAQMALGGPRAPEGWGEAKTIVKHS